MESDTISTKDSQANSNGVSMRSLSRCNAIRLDETNHYSGHSDSDNFHYQINLSETDDESPENKPKSESQAEKFSLNKETESLGDSGKETGSDENPVYTDENCNEINTPTNKEILQRIQTLELKDPKTTDTKSEKKKVDFNDKSVFSDKVPLKLKTDLKPQHNEEERFYRRRPHSSDYYETDSSHESCDEDNIMESSQSKERKGLQKRNTKVYQEAYNGAICRYKEKRGKVIL